MPPAPPALYVGRMNDEDRSLDRGDLDRDDEDHIRRGED